MMMMKQALFVFVWIHAVSSLELKKLSSCQTALGMQSGAIPDSAISASSSYDLTSVGPKASRARTEQYGGAWCPSNQITSIPREWLQIDFGNLTYLSQVESQGRFDNGRGKEFVEFYMLMYTRSSNNINDDDSSMWIKYKLRINNGDNHTTWIRANQNTYMGEIRQLDPPIVARRIRFYPVSKQTKTVCMRVEVYGCPFSDGIVSYSMPQGRTDVNSLGDDTYDGKYSAKTNMLTGGLGQLSDGITGTEDITIVDNRQPWIGWSNDSGTHVTLTFEFDYLRQMTRVTIHTNNLFSKQISVFKTAIISFSRDGHSDSYSNALVSQQIRDDSFDIARPILIELNNHIAKYVRLDLYFDAKWLLISEITFDSQIFSPENEEKQSSLSLISNRKQSGHLEQTLFSDNLRVAADLRKRNRDVLPATSLTMTTGNTPTGGLSRLVTTELSLAFFIGASLAVGLLLIVSLVWLIRRKKKLQFQKLTEKPCSNSSCYAYPTLPVREFHDLNAPTSGAIDDREYAVPDVNFYSTFSRSPHLGLNKSRLPPSTASSYTCSPRLVRTSTTACPSVNSSANRYPTLKTVPHCCIHQQPYLTMCRQPSTIFMPSSLQQDAPPIEAVCGNSLMIKVLSSVDHQTLPIAAIASENVRLIEKLGEGTFGSVHLAEMQLVDGEHRCSQILVKSVNDNGSESAKLSFWKEIELMSTLNDRHVCSLLGTLNGQRTVAIFEYYPLDLYQYLRRQSSITIDTSSSSFLLSLACQIASGMTYLASLNIVHRDLAARNCLITVSNSFQLRLTDTAMARVDYANDYARVGRFQSRIAVRWAAWESIFLNQFSLKSDVWSFGVTLFELFTYARERPYHTLSNEQLVQQLAALSQLTLPPPPPPPLPLPPGFISVPLTSPNPVTNVQLPQPELCSKEIYDLMCECWQRDAIRRPLFADIHTFLLGKASGSAPLVSTEQL